MDADLTIDRASVDAAATRCGLDLVGVAEVSFDSRDTERLEAWQRAGFAGSMSFMERPASLLADPCRLLPSARSVIVCAAHYDRTPLPDRPEGYGRVARYAWGRDYHRVLKKRVQRLANELERLVGRPYGARVFTDATPLLERTFAVRAGIGFQGKNTMVIRPRAGSFFLLAELLSELKVVAPSTLSVIEGGCGSCSRCLDRCPTGAFAAPMVLDARRCISYLTIEKVGVLEPHERRMLGEWLVGCDLCQEVCPFNHMPLSEGIGATIPELGAGAGCGPLLSLSALLAIRWDSSFMGRFKGTPLMRPGREYLLRNAACVAANTGATSVLASLRSAAQEDASAVVRLHALWALAVLEQREGQRSDLIERALRDPDHEVQDEARRLLNGAEA